jgi:putative IMPACT (imprinted ancient) family translation regulator
MMALAYPFYERLRLMIAEHHGVILDQYFGGDVTISARFPVEHFQEFQEALRELTRGAVQAEIIETNPDTILPLERL